MVFQGTVWGPALWNIFYADAAKPIHKHLFTDIIFADDLNAFRKYGPKVPQHQILEDMSSCQAELHAWGRANQVSFDAGKESHHILSITRPYGSGFELLGVSFDTKLLMADSVDHLAKDCRWKLAVILRTRRFNTGEQLVALYKAQLLSFIEYRTAAIYHACDSALASLDRIQDKLLEAAGASRAEALGAFNLAPLSARRDIALLGLIHRAVLGRGPQHFREFFKLNGEAGRASSGRHRLQLVEYEDGHWTDFALPRSCPANYIRHSVLGLVSVYNRLPASIVEVSSSVSFFQSGLQDLLRHSAGSGDPDWARLFSPRVPWHKHPLSKYA